MVRLTHGEADMGHDSVYNLTSIGFSPDRCQIPDNVSSDPMSEGLERSKCLLFPLFGYLGEWPQDSFGMAWRNHYCTNWANFAGSVLISMQLLLWKTGLGLAVSALETE